MSREGWDPSGGKDLQYLRWIKQSLLLKSWLALTVACCRVWTGCAKPVCPVQEESAGSAGGRVL